MRNTLMGIMIHKSVTISKI